MKKLIAITLCLIMVLPIFGCTTGDSESKSSVLQVGFGRVDISPYELKLPLHGYGNPTERISTKVQDPIYATCVAFTDVNNNTILLYHMDLGSCSSELLMNKRSISRATDVPSGNIMISATHNHSGPDLSVSNNESVTAYIEILDDAMIEAAKAAMADRKPAEMYMATTKINNMNFCRHYNMKDGSVAGDNFGSLNSGVVDHVVQADNDLQILKFVREGGNDVVLVNWQTHPHRNSSSTSTAVSSDIVGTMRDYMEKQTDCSFAYFSGASGNINPTSRISSENITKDYVEQGEKMGEYAVAACENMTKVNTHNVQVVSKSYTAKSTKEADHTFSISAFSIGDVGFICAPYEMFSENGQKIKESSPFKMTMVVTYANGANGYIASEATYAYGGYEVEYRNYVKGTAEELVSEYISMLTELHKTR